jgi:hypothetical protein
MRVCAIVFLAVLTLTACTQAAPFAASKAQTQIDDFKLGHVGIVTAHMERGVYSDEIQEEDLKSSLRSAITSRLSEYQGQSGFNIGVNVEAYAHCQCGRSERFIAKIYFDNVRELLG